MTMKQPSVNSEAACTHVIEGFFEAGDLVEQFRPAPIIEPPGRYPTEARFETVQDIREESLIFDSSVER